ncbi:putative ABC transporter permease [Allofournierella massiliensis]|uniref:Putative ABC transporter type IV n=1 Tax=Allofournierella massiliensis TaxID=1650663 RepID=A0A4R1R1I6_9FIRM|nr:putative ABC transporter permease [Fournierella massiliensis]TCL59191.1 putative ABC transporter type IV [Fournierella massiliensis]
MYELSMLFLYFIIYAFLGWCAEVAVTAVKQRRFVNRGVMNGPIVPLYGLMATLAGVFLEPEENNLLVFVLGAVVLCTAVEVVAGVILERQFGRRWWDYSDRPMNLKGYICLESSLIKGVLVALAVRFLTPVLHWGLSFLPAIALQILALVLAIILAVDALVMVYGVHAVRRRWKMSEPIAEYLQQASETIGDGLTTRTLGWYQGYQKRHLAKAFPNLTRLSAEDERPDANVFAAGIGFYKLFWLFLIGAFVGDLIETVFVWGTSGVLMSRSSLLYGPFSVVWGLGAAILTVVLRGLMDKSDRYIFVGGALMGGVYEYMCSVVTEKLFGKVFWDYSKIPFNLNGRINLLYCVFWGIAAVVWVKEVYPRISALIEKIPMKVGKILTWVLVVLLAVDVALSCMALGRMDQREKGIPATNAVQQFLDEQYPDEYLTQRYQNMKLAG